MLFVYAGCGVNALPGLQNRPKSIYCGDCVGLIGIAHQPVFHLSAV
ncbi:hypothetical protein CF58_02695 [Escherichia coli]|nr:hypothetical protein CF58_02695 [Escherichia coli]AHM46620.1 hypothetical protein CF59_02745 [Escherichia coli]AHM51175.1 hypothetical protein CF60_02735 [Escherichia coli]